MRIEFSLKEEIVHAVMHGVGVLLGIAALSILVVLAEGSWRIVSFSIYGATLTLLYLASTFYHGIQHRRAKEILRIIDHSSIYLLIAGSYTPFALVTLHGPWGWTLFGLVWGLALAGIFQKIFLLNRFPILSVLIYIGMGWLILIAIKPLHDALPLKGIAWLVAGGLSYTLGCIFYGWRKLPFNHAIWHLFVLGGSTCHFFGILFYVLPT